MRELCQEMHGHLRSVRVVELLDTAFRQLPEPVTPPQLCYQRLIRGGTERVRLADAPGRVAAAMVTVTPPGIPVLMPGESVGAEDRPLLRYLTALESFDRRFPGFRSETHGVTLAPETGDYMIECLQLEQHQEMNVSKSLRAAAPAQSRGSEASGHQPKGQGAQAGSVGPLQRHR